MLGKRILVTDELKEIPKVLFPSFKVINSMSLIQYKTPGVLFYYEGRKPPYEITGWLTTCYQDRWLFVTSYGHVAVDVSLNTKESILVFMRDEMGVVISDTMLKRIVKVSDSDFVSIVRLSVLLGKIDSKSVEAQAKVYKLFEALVDKPNMEVAELYFSLLDSLSPNEIFASILSFLQRASANEDESVSVFYKRILSKARSTGFDLESLFMELTFLESLPKELTILKFLLSIRG